MIHTTAASNTPGENSSIDRTFDLQISRLVLPACLSSAYTVDQSPQDRSIYPKDVNFRMLTVSELIAIASMPNLLNRSGLEPVLIVYLLLVAVARLFATLIYV